ncbi:MAG: hypothetical protein HZA53_05805 [Planctomycetes bacterium]|nr:hypothetical protein [Planctomycetota bacterium]
MRRLFRAFAAVALGLVLALLLSEGCVRWLVFSPDPLAAKLGAEVRTPDAFGRPDSSERWWYLQRRFAEEGSIAPTRGPNSELGWDIGLLDPETGLQRAVESLGDRRPILLYGDSFAAGVTAPGCRFQSLCDRSDLADRFVLLNHGVGGYGLDQSVLMMERTLATYAARRPIVILSMLVESDLDRSALGFRNWPKPKFEVVDGALAGPASFELDPDRWFEAHLSTIHSYAYDLLLNTRGPFDGALLDRLRELDERIPEKRALNRLLLERAFALIRRHGAEAFVLLFHCPGTLEDKPWVQWQEPLIRATCERLDLPCLDTRPFLLAASGGEWDAADAFHVHGGLAHGHLNEVGNQIAFEAIREGVEGRARAPDLARLHRMVARGLLPREGPALKLRSVAGIDGVVRANPGGWCLRDGTDLGNLVETGGRASIVGRGARNQPCEIALFTDGAPRRFVGELRFARREGKECEPCAVRLTVSGGPDGTVVHDVGPGWTPRDLDARMDAVDPLLLRFEALGPGAECSWVAIVGARLE